MNISSKKNLVPFKSNMESFLFLSCKSTIFTLAPGQCVVKEHSTIVKKNGGRLARLFLLLYGPFSSNLLAL